MAQLERSVGAAPARASELPQTEIDSLPGLFGRLGDDVMTLVDAKLGLIKVELKEDAAVYARSAALMGIGAVVATIGFVLFNIAVAFFVSKLFTFADPRLNYALGFLVTGLVYLIAGGIILLVMKSRVAAYDPTPKRSLDEIRKDKQWLKNEI